MENKQEVKETPNKPDDSTFNDQEIDIKNKNIKYPFSGIAPNLMDKFLVVGYEPKTIEYTMQNCEAEPKPELKTRFHFYDFEERPSIVNEICNDFSKDLLDNDLILELIFPNMPQMYYLEKQYINTKKEPDEELLISNYSIIFSINPQDNSGSKKSYNGLGYVFYVANEHRSMGELDGFIYYPIAYVILSEFPYFYHFNEICKNVYIQMKKENDEIPIDIILYNAIKYIPSPLGKNINLSFGALIGFPQEQNNKIEKILETLNSNSSRENKGIPTMFFNQLSGYPFMDINLSFIFNLIPPEIIVEVFIFSFLEHDIIFYSSRPEILNMVMYIFSNLNYPFNDSIYYWHVLSVSEDSFMSGSSTFVGKTCSTITGILSEYDPELLTTKKIREHFVLDIDNKNFFFLYQEETEEVQDTMTLYNYIKNCASEAEDMNGDKKMDKETKVRNYFNDGIQLYEVIKNLMDELQRRAKKVTSTNYNERIIKPTFLTMYEDESEIECFKANIRLQKAFFTFITQIMQNFVRILSISEESNSSKDNSYSDARVPSLVINIKKDENINPEEETKRRLAKKAGDIFKEKFQDCSKYSSFVINFCKFHETIDLYKIPYTFINEFVYYSHVAVRNNLSEVDVFKLIDQFYGRRKMIDFEEIINKNDKGKSDNKNNENNIEDNDKVNKSVNEKSKKDEKNKSKKDKKKEEKNKKKDNNDKLEIIADNLNIINNPPTFETDLENIYLFSFDKFALFYKDNLRALINREQDDDREIFTKVKATNKAFKKYKRNGFYLSNKVLSLYTMFSNNNSEELIKTFKLIRCEYEKPKEDGSDVNLRGSAPLPIKSGIIHSNSKNNETDYFSLLKEKEKFKKMDKNEKDLLLFGCYEFNEITDVIERHFILERCFTSYALIKFSLLNILAITRGLNSLKIHNKDVITTMCDFCEKTKSLVRKYMNIYLNIFQSIKLKRILKDSECDECLSIIALYFKKTNMIPTEETTKAFNEIKNEIKENEMKEKEKKEKEIKEKEQEQEANKKSRKSSIQKGDNNFEKIINEKGNFFEIKEGLFSRNTLKKNEETLRTIETIFTGVFKNTSVFFDYKELEKLYHEIKDKKEKFIPMTPLSLYASTNKLLSIYLKKFTIDKKINEELGKDILSLLFYFKIPIIGLKWSEQYKPEDKHMTLKLLHKTLKKSNKELNKLDDGKNAYLDEFNLILRKIIAILYDLFDAIKIHETAS